MKRKRQIIKNTSIGTKIMFFVLVSLIVTVAIIFLVSTSRYDSFLSQVNQKQAETALMNLNKTVEDLTGQSRLNATLLSQDAAVSDAVRQNNAAALQTLVQDKNKAMNLDFVTITDSRGTVIFSLGGQQKQGESLLGSKLVKSALAGTALSDYGLDPKAVTLAYVTALPVKDAQGNVVGVLSAGCSMAKEALLDALKAIHGTDFTIFAGNIRLATTIIQDGKRVVGTPLAAATAEKVITNQQTYYGQATILSQQYLTAYKPLLDADKNTVGVLFAGKPLAEVKKEQDTILAAVLVLGLVLLAFVSVAIVLFMRVTVSKPMLKMVESAKRISLGEIETKDLSSAQAGRGVAGAGHNELLLLSDAFSQIMTSSREQAGIAAEIANGNTGVQMHARSENDTLTLSMIRVIDTLKGLTGEINRLISASREGNFRLRGDTARFSGDYAAMVKGVNDILDEALAAMDEAQKARQTAEKQARYQAGEVDMLVVNLKRLSRGELHCDMEAAPADEDTAKSREMFVEISGNLHVTVDTIKRYIEDISEVLGRIAEGDLTSMITADFQGEFAKLKSSINDIVESLGGVLSNINHSAEQVAAGSGQVSGGSQALTQGATEQASAIEQLTASMTEIARQTRQNAMNAGQANELTMTARDFAVEGNVRMKNLQQAMTEIDEASASISRVIKVIDDIAFQTNLLALNAAVEAARAGQHGKGFAVVAEEVRSLAARSAGAAKETTMMIQESINKAKAGTKMANEATLALEKIVSSVEKATELMGGIARASNEQATAVAQVNSGIEQVSKVVQTNSATAEESAAASEELSSQATLLKEMVARFNLNQETHLAQKSTVAKLTPRPLGEGGHAAKKPVIALSDKEFGKY